MVNKSMGSRKTFKATTIRRVKLLSKFSQLNRVLKLNKRVIYLEAFQVLQLF